jgi:hypothetical protein
MEPVTKAVNREKNKEAFLAEPGVQQKITAIANNLGISEDELLYAIAVETAGSYSSAQRNLGDGRAVGLIQFYPDNKNVDYKTIQGVRYETSDLEKMSSSEQLDIVEKYLIENFKNKGGKPGELYVSIAYPDLIGKSDETEIDPSRLDSVSAQNPSWVKDGKITKGSISNSGSKPEFSNFTTESSNNKQIDVEEKNITTLQQSVIDNLNAKIDEQEVLGLDNEEAILKKGVEDYILSLNENDLINANKLSYDDIKNLSEKPEEDYSSQKDKIQNILDNKSEYNIDVINNARLAKQNIARYTDDDSVPISKENLDKSLVFLNELQPKQTKQEKQPAQPAREQIKPITLDPVKTVVPDTELAEPIKQEQPLENITRLQNFLSKMKRSEGQRNINALANTAQGVTAILSAAAGIKSMIKATEKDPVSKSYVDPLFKEALLKIRQVSNQGIPYEARQSAMKDINNAYTGAMKNVMAISGGQRGLALSNIGVVDANRVNALVNLAAKDSDIRQKNLELFAKTSSDYSQQKLNANMAYDKLNSTIEDNRKNRLQTIGSGLFEQAMQQGTNYMATRTESNLLNRNDDNNNNQSISALQSILGELQDGVSQTNTINE